MKPLPKEESIKKTPFLRLVSDLGEEPPKSWLEGLEIGQWFISKNKISNDLELWMLKFKFKTTYLLYTNMNIEFRKLVNPVSFSNTNDLVEKLDKEE